MRIECEDMADISTHAPAGGATGPRDRQPESPEISTHAPAGGATEAWLNFEQLDNRISTHAPAGGATQAGIVGKGAAGISTHAPAGGATGS